MMKLGKGFVQQGFKVLTYFLVMVGAQAVAGGLNVPDKFDAETSAPGMRIGIMDVSGRQYVYSKYEVKIPNVNILSIKEQIFGVDALADWFDEVVEARLIDVESERLQRCQLLLDMPFPYRHRTITMQQKVTELQSDKILIELSADYTGIPHSDRFVRVTEYEGEWIIEQMGSDALLTYHTISTPQLGGIPEAFIINNVKKSIDYFIKTLGNYNFQST